ncbi:MAG: hypothetical protein ACSW8E_00495 [Clostridia bacterium]
MRQAWRALALLLCLTLLLGGCGQPDIQPAPTPSVTAEQSPAPSAEPTAAPTETPGPRELTLWLAEDAPLAEAIHTLTAEYNAQQPAWPLRLQSYASETALTAALGDSKPDLLLCGERTAARLKAAGALGSLAWPDEPAALFREAPGCAEGAYFPLGAELQLLVLRQENRTLLAGCDSLEALCETAARYGRQQGRPFFSADSFARLFACAMAQKGSPFFGTREQDLESEAYRALYNLLAEAAFDGGLIPPEDAVLPSVRNGDLVCGVVSSRELLKGERTDLAAFPLPPMAGCEALTDAKLCGLAVLPGADSEGTARFLGWLYAEGRSAEAALEAGLMPAADGAWSETDAVTAGLAQALRNGRFYLPPEDCGLLLHGTDFEQSFRAALALLG